MCIRDRAYTTDASGLASTRGKEAAKPDDHVILPELISKEPVSYTHLRAHETVLDLVCRLLLEKKN